MEYKLDGERVMLHFQRRATGEPRVEWWTRNCHNATAQYNEPMGPVLRKVIPPTCSEALLDGEMMVWNGETGEYAPFGENRSLNNYQRRHEHNFQPCYVVFGAPRTAAS